MLKKTFVNGRLNKDVDERLLSDGDYKDALNIEVIDSEGSDVGAVENSLSNKQLTNIDLGLNPINLGKYEDEAEDKLYWFEKSDTATFLLEYDARNNITSIVLKDSRPSGNGRVLDLDDDHRITGIIKVISENTKDDLLIWTDNNIEIFCINIERAKSWVENGFEREDVYLIKKQPKTAPITTPTYSSEESNYLEETIISFGYRYKYLDGERSAISTYSNCEFSPKKFQLDYQTMENIGMVNSFNAVRIQFDTGEKQVTDIEVIGKKSNSTIPFLIARFNKEEEGWGDDQMRDLIFSNNKNYKPIAEKEYFRTFDNVPRKAKALSLIENIPVLGNYVEGYDMITESGDTIKMDYTIDVQSNDISGTTIPVTLLSNGESIQLTFPSEVEYNEGNRIIFDFRLSESTYSGSFTGFLEFILPQDFDDATQLAANDDFINFIETILTNNFISGYEATVPGNYNQTANTPFDISGSTANTITIDAIVLTFTIDNSPDPDTTEDVQFEFTSATSILYSNLESFASCKTNMDYEIGFLYQDHWIRKSTVLVSNSNTVYIPQKLSTFQNRLLVNVNHLPPYWAESYKIVVKATALQYQNIFVSTFYVDGLFRWIKLDGANKDKVKEGDTLIVKSDLSGPVDELIKVRVIELSEQEDDFITGNTGDSGFEIKEKAGLYMKIKPSGFDMNLNQEDAFFTYPAFTRTRSGNPSVILGGAQGSLAGYLNPDTDLYVDYEIKAGSQISIKFHQYEKDETNGLFEKSYIVQADYVNFEAWWAAEVVDLGDQESRFTYGFFRSPAPISNNALFLAVTGNDNGTIFEESKLSCQIDIILSEGVVVFETEQPILDSEIFYETEQTFDIENGLHLGNVSNQTVSDPASLNLNFFNCFVQGNGVESYRVKDALDAEYLNIDFKPTTTTIEPYKEIRRFADLTFGEPFVESTNFNGLNVFNVSTINFKELDKQYNSIQFLFSRDTNLIVFQEDKVGYVLFGKDLIRQANGDVIVAEVPEILGGYVPYAGENGVGLNPESIAWDAFRIYYVNPRRGTPIRLSIDGISEINYGMVSHFRDLFIDNPNSLKLGGYDPYHKKYALTSYDDVGGVLLLSCGNTINKIVDEVFTYELQLNGLSGEIVLNYDVYLGNATIEAIHDGVSNVVSNISGVGSINIARVLTDNKVSVTITPVGGSASIEIGNSCPVGNSMKLISIVTNDDADIGNTIINRFKRNNGQYYSNNHFFDVEGVSQFLVEDGSEGVGKFPASGETVTIQAFKDTLSTGDFLLSEQNRIGYLVTDQLYTQADINTILAAATFVPVTFSELSQNSNLHSGSFIFNRPSENHHLYLIWDYALNNQAPIAVNDSAMVQQGDSVIIDVLANDSDPDTDPIVPIIVTQPSHGSAVVNGDNTITYTHDNSPNFSDSFTYKVNDGNSDSNVATVTLDISELIIDNDTFINIYFDSSGSMDDTLVPLQTMRDTLLKDALLPLYDNETEYNNKVQVIQDAGERMLDMLDFKGAAPPVGNQIVLVFMDESNPIYHDASAVFDPNATRTAQYDTDIAAFRTRLAGFAPDFYRGVVFQVDFPAGPDFKGFVQAVENGTGLYNLSNGLSDRAEVLFKYDITDGGTAQYYRDQIISALQELGYNV